MPSACVLPPIKSDFDTFFHVVSNSELSWNLLHYVFFFFSKRERVSDCGGRKLMASALKKVVKEMVKPLKRSIGFGHHNKSPLSGSGSDTIKSDLRRVPSDSLALYVGLDEKRYRFVIPARYLNLPVFGSLLKMSEKDFGFQLNGGLIIPCEARFFNLVLKLLHQDEHRFGKMGMEDFLTIFADQQRRFDACRQRQMDPTFTPLLQHVEV